MPNADQSGQTGSIGVTLMQLAVESELGWIFRRVEHRDTGLDAEIEVVFGGDATGLLLGLQVKSGASQFSEPTDHGWRYRGDYDHLRYWRDHNLSVIVALVDVEERRCYWAAVGPDTEIREAANSWTIEVPADNVLGESCAQEWMDLAWACSPKDALYRYCVLHRPYIDLLAKGGRVFLEVDDWANKTRGQAGFQLVLATPDERQTVQEFGFFAGVYDPFEFAKTVFPWAHVSIDEEFYEDYEDAEPGAVFQDSEEPGGYHVFERERPVGTIRPYTERGGGEVLKYRFELVLNETGKAFSEFSMTAMALTAYPPYRAARMIARMIDD